MKPFDDYDLQSIFQQKYNQINARIESITNEEILANDLDIISENIYQEFFIEPVKIGEEDPLQRKITQTKIMKQIDPFFRAYGESACVEVDGIRASFAFPFAGDPILFRCHASTFSVSGYPDITIKDNFFIIECNRDLEEIKGDDTKDKILTSVNKAKERIKSGISYANSDVNGFNNGLHQYIEKNLNSKKKKVQSFYNLATMFEVPVEKNEYAKTVIPLQRKIVPISHTYNKEPYFVISEENYKDVLDSLKHTLSTYERTPESYKSMQEEDLRNTLLAALNATYKGSVTGETFRRNGKTDICIEQENRAAFVAECKIWKGAKAIIEAVKQLDGYLTWRDCKTALIVFVRQKDFIKVLDKAKEALGNYNDLRSLKEIDKNEFECVYLSQSHPGQLVKMRVMLFDLSYDE